MVGVSNHGNSPPDCRGSVPFSSENNLGQIDPQFVRLLFETPLKSLNPHLFTSQRRLNLLLRRGKGGIVAIVCCANVPFKTTSRAYRPPPTSEQPGLII